MGQEIEIHISCLKLPIDLKLNLSLGSSAAGPKLRIQPQVVYLGGGLKKTLVDEQISEIRKGRQPRKSTVWCLQSPWMVVAQVRKWAHSNKCSAGSWKFGRRGPKW